VRGAAVFLDEGEWAMMNLRLESNLGFLCLLVPSAFSPRVEEKKSGSKAAAVQTEDGDIPMLSEYMPSPPQAEGTMYRAPAKPKSGQLPFAAHFGVQGKQGKRKAACALDASWAAAVQSWRNHESWSAAVACA